MAELVQDDCLEVPLRIRNTSIGAKVPGRKRAFELGDYLGAGVGVARAARLFERAWIRVVVALEIEVVRAGLTEEPARLGEVGPGGSHVDDLVRHHNRLQFVDRRLERR